MILTFAILDSDSDSDSDSGTMDHDYPLLEHCRTAPNMSDTVGVTPISASRPVGTTWAAHQLATEESKMRCLCVVVLLWTAASAPYANVQYLSIACRMFVWISF